jgi:hypothetical protein
MRKKVVTAAAAEGSGSAARERAGLVEGDAAEEREGDVVSLFRPASTDALNRFKLGCLQVWRGGGELSNIRISKHINFIASQSISRSLGES